MHGGSPGGRVEVICGGMFSGKSEELIRRVRRAQIARQRVQVFKPAIDGRFGANAVGSHNGATVAAVPVDDSRALAGQIDPASEVVAIDEAQFFDDGLVPLVHALAARGVRVIVAGLDMDFRGEPFGPMPALLATAEEVTKLQAICVVCGAPASRSQRLIEGRPAAYGDPVVLIGAREVYEARCREHHQVPGAPTAFPESGRAVS